MARCNGTRVLLDAMRPGLQCTACGNVASDSNRLVPCNHLFCGRCAPHMTICVTCKVQVTGRYIDAAAAQEAASFLNTARASCTRCAWTGPVPQFDRHFTVQMEAYAHPGTGNGPQAYAQMQQLQQRQQQQQQQQQQYVLQSSPAPTHAGQQPQYYYVQQAPASTPSAAQQAVYAYQPAPQQPAYSQQPQTPAYYYYYQPQPQPQQLQPQRQATPLSAPLPQHQQQQQHLQQVVYVDGQAYITVPQGQAAASPYASGAASAASPAATTAATFVDPAVIAQRPATGTSTPGPAAASNLSGRSSSRVTSPAPAPIDGTSEISIVQQLHQALVKASRSPPQQPAAAAQASRAPTQPQSSADLHLDELRRIWGASTTATASPGAADAHHPTATAGTKSPPSSSSNGDAGATVSRANRSVVDHHADHRHQQPSGAGSGNGASDDMSNDEFITVNDGAAISRLMAETCHLTGDIDPEDHRKIAVEACRKTGRYSKALAATKEGLARMNRFSSKFLVKSDPEVDESWTNASGPSAAAKPATLSPAHRPTPAAAAEPGDREAKRGSTTGGELQIFWDLDNLPIPPNTNARQMYTAIIDFFVERGIIQSRHQVYTHVYYVENAPLAVSTVNREQLRVMGCVLVSCTKRKEDADRQIATAMSQLTSFKSKNPVAVLSSDKDFTVNVQRLRKHGNAVYVVHDAKPRSEHEEILKFASTAAFRIYDVVRGWWNANNLKHPNHAASTTDANEIEKLEFLMQKRQQAKSVRSGGKGAAPAHGAAYGSGGASTQQQQPDGAIGKLLAQLEQRQHANGHHEQEDDTPPDPAIVQASRRLSASGNAAGVRQAGDANGGEASDVVRMFERARRSAAP